MEIDGLSIPTTHPSVPLQEVSIPSGGRHLTLNREFGTDYNVDYPSDLNYICFPV